MTRGTTITCCSGDFERGLRASLRAGLAGLVLASAMVGAPARAAEPADVEYLIRQGVEQRTQGHDQAAMPMFQRAYDLERSPRTAAQLGLCEAALGYWLAAERHLTEALSSARHPWVEKNRNELEATLKAARGSIGELEITGRPVGAEVIVNGKTVGTLPLAEPVRLAEGMVNLELRAGGYQEKTTAVRVAGGTRQTVTLALVAGKGESAAAARAAGLHGGGTGTGEVAGADVAIAGKSGAPSGEAAASGGAPHWVRPAAWVATGLGVVALGVGSYGLWNMVRYQGEFNDKVKTGTTIRACDAGVLPGRGAEGCAAAYDKGASGQRLALAGFQASGLLAAVAVVGFLWSSGGDNEGAHASAGHPRGVQAFATLDGNGGASAGWQQRF